MKLNIKYIKIKLYKYAIICYVNASKLYGGVMATATKQNSIFIRIEPDEKKELEEVCSKIGVTPATAAKIFYKQLVRDRAFPFTPTAEALP